MTFIPATMFLLDEHAWKFPKWLGKIIPTVDVEGESLIGLKADGSRDSEPEAKADGAHLQESQQEGR